MRRFLLRLLRLRVLARLLRTPVSWSSLAFMLVAWLVGRRR